MGENEDIGEVVNDSADKGPGGAKVITGEIVAVISCDSYNSCRSCKSKVTSDNGMIGECTKCGLKLKMSKCAKSVAARLLIEDTTTGKEQTLTAFNVIDTIIHDQEGADVAEKFHLSNTRSFNTI